MFSNPYIQLIENNYIEITKKKINDEMLQE